MCEDLKRFKNRSICSQNQKKMFGAIIHESIIKNKAKTKEYWEQKMSADVQGLINIKNSMDGMKESLIEREIRIQKEREEALANERQKAIKLAQESKGEDSCCLVQKPHTNGIDSVTEDLRLSHEIKNYCQESLSKNNELSNNHRVQEPKPAQRKSMMNKKFSSMTNISVLGLEPQLSISYRDRNKTPTTPNTGFNNSRQTLPFKAQKGLMQKFLETHGRKVPTVNNSTTPTPPTALPVAPRRKIEFTELVVEQPQNHPNWTKRPGYISTDDKIQKELEEMRKREFELKAERARNFGRSQPNLQLIGLEDEQSDDSGNESMGQLRSVLSNPNLLEDKVNFTKGPQKRRSALIDAWENRIKNEQNTNN